MPGASEVESLVIGAGVAGLAAATRLDAAGREMLVVDAGDAPGGVMRSDRVGDYLIERGPNSLLLRPALAAFLREYQLVDTLVKASPASRKRSLLRGGELVPVPLGPADLLRTPLLSRRAKWRLLAEPFTPAADARDESVSSFVARRLGPEVVSALVGPFLTGVYAGDERKLEAESVMTSLVDFERESGSIARGALLAGLEGLRARAGELRGGRAAPRGIAGTWSHPDGLGGLSHAVAGRLGCRLALRSRVSALARDGQGFRVEWSGPEGERSLRAREVVVALPAREASELLKGLDPAAAELAAAVRYSPLVTVALGSLPAPGIEGFGFLVPRGEDDTLLGCLFPSQLYSGRAPRGRELLHCMLGGARDPGRLDCDDAELFEHTTQRIVPLLGLTAEPERIAVRRWPRAVAQPEVGHTRRIAKLRRELAAFRGLRVCGGWLDGVSVADALACGQRAGDSLVG